ncbi:DNA mismatch repair protein msh6 [Termitomyces sp. T112]|nr:DNA mismatch repair protein msh6 [Termitomyces sp. T112]
MAPKKANAEHKQKSLMSWFSKDTNAPSSTMKPQAKTKLVVAPSDDASMSQSSSQEPQTPASKSSNIRALNSSAMGRSVSSRSHSTPPTSDPIDVDMLTSDEEDPHLVQKTSQRKRKVVLLDSDEENDNSVRKQRKSTQPDSSPVSKAVSKKQRITKARTDDEDEDDEDSGPITSFSQRLTNFKKSPVKKARKSRSNASEDDDFIVPSDSDGDTKSVKSSVSRSSVSSRRSAVSSEDEFSDDGDHVKSKSKSKSSRKKAPSAKQTSAVSNGGTSGLFLTAAERREQGKKDEKKAAETPYSFLEDIKDKEGRRPGEPDYDPRTIYIPKSAWVEFTPFEKQFWEIKQNHYDTILFFQKGKFLELYEDDARIGHQEFDLKLTSRVKMSMVGVPEMSFNFWAAKFLGKGYKVGRVDQAETALGAEMRMAADKSQGKVSKDKNKEKIVRRELNKVYTNGTLVDAELLTDEQAGHCVSIHEGESQEDLDNNKFGICVLDCSTSQFDLSAFEDDVCRTKLETLMRQLRPKELLFIKGNLSVATTRLLKAVLPAACLWTGLRPVEGFTYDETLQELRKMYSEEEDDATMADEDEENVLPSCVPEPIRAMVASQNAIKALGSMIWYLRQLNIDKDILSMKNFNVYDPMKKGQGLTLDGQTLAHIEVLLNNEATEEGSLLKLLGRCVTPFGKRLFRIWLCMPLRQISDINARLDAVQDLIDHQTFEADFTELAKGMPDLERIVSRIHAKNCKIRDFLKVLASFKKLSIGLSRLADTSESFNSKTIFGLLRSAPDLLPHIKNIESLYVKPSSDKDDELIPREGKDSAYDEIMTEITDLEVELENDLKKMEKKLGYPLSYWHSAQGNKEIYLVETSAGQKGIPDDWTKSSATKAKSRWVIRSLQKKVRQLKEARENRNTAIKNFKSRLFAEFDTDRSVWLRIIKVFAELDCLFSLAKSSVAIGEPVCRPEFVEGDTAWVDFEELRHPTLSLTSSKSFIPNDVKLGGDVGKIVLLTGPNMAGKSTLMRMTAIGVIIAQLGMLVPASRARLCPVDSIITRMGAYDNMFSNASTFKVELDECCKILRDATPKSLVILDELGRGTSTYDGMAIAGAVLHQLATHTLPLSFFATHYGSLTDDFAYHPNIRNMHMSTLVDDEKRDLVFLFKLIEGAATSSFGTHVANIAGVPLSVVERADVVSKNFAQQFKERMQVKQMKNSGRLPIEAHADFAYLYKAAMGLLALPVNPVRRKEMLFGLRQTVQQYVKK